MPTVPKSQTALSFNKSNIEGNGQEICKSDGGGNTEEHMLIAQDYFTDDMSVLKQLEAL